MASTDLSGTEVPAQEFPNEAQDEVGSAQEPEAATAPEASNSQFFVVGIGASAGGLEALSALLAHITIDNAAFVVVQHLAPHQNSMLAELLGRASTLRVVTAEDGMIIQPNNVYVTPPNAELALLNGVLHVMPPDSGERLRMPIDAFFRSLAEDRGNKAIGVVLSGTGTDGTFGLAAIKAAGGITFVQDPKTAKFDGMPRSALDSGAADFCLSPQQIADEIPRLSSHPYLRRSPGIPQFQEQLGKLALLVKNAFGIDLTHYKPNTIERRIQRRMAVHRVEQMSDYLRICQKDRKELAALHGDLLINVTRFFRDVEPFEVLKQDILPRLLQDKKEHDPFRIWVPGCSSGEEAYSLGICLLELFEQKEYNVKVQIFGTDVDPDAIQQARRGIYPPNIATDVSPERLRKYFIRTEDGRYQICRRVRDMAVFSVQNLSRDPPFSKLDLVSCRNLLIYLQPGIQKKVLRILHYSLQPRGALLLGTSESVGEASDLFSLLDRKNKIYQTKHVATLDSSFELGAGAPVMAPAPAHPQYIPSRPAISIAQLADRQILEQHAPPAVVINASCDILYFRGRTERFLQQPSGLATHNILRLVRPELHALLKTTIDSVLSSSAPASATGQLKTGDSTWQPITLVAQPLQEPETRARCVLILFKDVPPGLRPAESASPDPARAADRPDAATQELKQELALTRDYLQSTIEELQRVNEDLNSTNEELQSSNEELQSTNEELETSKEELQSTNEELITLNDELQNRMRDLGGANDDLHNLLLGVDHAVVIVGLDQRIRRYTQSAEKLLNLLPTDIGRSVAQLNAFLGSVGIEKLISDVIGSVRSVEREVLATDRRWYALRIVPYRTLDLSIRGAVLSIIDIDVPKRRAELTNAVGEYASEALSAIQNPLLIVNQKLAVIWVNDAYYQTFHLLPEEVIGTKLAKIGTGEWAAPQLLEQVASSLETNMPFRDLQLTVSIQGLGRTRIRLSGSRIRRIATETPLLLLTLEGDFRPASSVNEEAP
jgi:two-component system CheB/CheR fusion protein